MKSCTQCAASLPLAAFNKCAATKDGLHRWCRACQAAYNKSYSLNNPEKRKAAKAAWYQANKDRHRKHHKAWADRNRAQQRAAVARWAKENPEAKRATNRAYAAAHRSERNAARDVYRRANLGRDVAKATTRKIRKLRAMPQWANAFFIEEIYDLAQRRSRATGVAWHVDHVVPLRNLSVCGLHAEDNLRVILGVENLRKSNKWSPL